MWCRSVTKRLLPQLYCIHEVLGQVCLWIFSSENRVTRFRKIYEWHVYEGGIFGILNFIMYINWLIWCNKYITDITKWLLLHWQSYVYNTEITERGVLTFIINYLQWKYFHMNCEKRLFIMCLYYLD